MAAVNRRTVLRGVGVTMCLPWLDSLSAFASTGSSVAFPKRFAVLFMGNGINENHWGAEGSGAAMKLLPDGTYHLACGSSEMGNGIPTAHKQIAASIVGVRAKDVALVNADTDRTPYDTGTYASTGTVVAGNPARIVRRLEPSGR